MKENLPKITKEEFLTAITDGVKNAIHEFMETGDGYSGSIIRDYVIDKISIAIEKGIHNAFPDNEMIIDIIYKAVYSATKNK